jgi:hypothetical protein
MKVSIEVKNRDEGNLLKAALDDPVVRALALVMGALSTLPTDRAKRRALAYVQDRLQEDEAGKAAIPHKPLTTDGAKP